MTGDPNYGSVSLLLPFDGANNSTVFRDRSNSRKTITVNGNAKVSTAQSKFGGASLLLDGTGDYLSIPSHADFLFGTGNFTIEAWVRPAALPTAGQYYGVVARRETSGNQAYSMMLNGDAGGALYFYLAGSAGGGTTTTSCVGPAPSAGGWSHVCVVRSGTTITAYTNGVAGTPVTLPFTDTHSGAYTLAVGRLSLSAANTGDFNGHIDDARITKGVARYTSTFDVPTAPHPIGLETVADPDYSNVSLLINADSATIVDESPSPKTITAVGQAALSRVDSKVGPSSIAFDGTGDYLTVPNHADFDFGTGDFTVELWANFANTSTTKTLLSNYSSALYGFVLQHRITAPLGLAFGNGDTTIISGAWTPTVSAWHHVAVCRSGSSVRLFVDGAQLGSTVTNSTNITGSTAPCYIGTLDTTLQPFSGYLDGIRVTKGVARYTSTFTPPNYVLSAEFPPPSQGAIVLTGQAPDLFLGYQPLQESIVLTGQVPVFDNTPAGIAYVTGRGFQSLPGILADSETTTVAGGTFGTVAKVFGGSLVTGTSFKTAPTLTVLTAQTGYVTGRGFSTTPAIEVSHDFVSTIQGRGFSGKATVVGGSIVVGGAFSTSLTATIDTPISLSVAGQGFQTRPTIVAEYQPAMRITGRGFVSGIGYSDVTGRGFTQNPVLKALETANFAEAFVFNLVPANQEENLYSVSRYQNYPFLHLTRIANDYYGVKADGLYRLTGEYDTTEDILVNGTIKLNEDDLNAFNSQNIPYIYLNGDDDYTATAFVDDVAQPAFSSGFNGRRVKLARGSKGRYWYFKIEGIKSLLGVEYRPEKLARKVK